MDTKSGPFKTSDFGENHQRAGKNGDKCPGPLETGYFGEVKSSFKAIFNVHFANLVSKKYFSIQRLIIFGSV